MKKLVLVVSTSLLFAGTNAQETKMVTSAVPGTTVQENKNQAEIKFEVEEYNFGTIKQGAKVNFDFSFTNAGKEPLIISQAQGSCGCTVPVWPKEPIAKGGKGVIHVEYNSAGKMGLQSVTVTITSNAREGTKSLYLKGNVEVVAADKK